MRYIRAVPTSYLSVRSAALRTAALVNVLSGERVTPGAVADVLREHGEAEPLDLVPGDVAEMRAVAARVRELFVADGVDLAAARLNRLLGRTTGTVRLTSHDGRTPWHPHLDSDDEAPWGEWFLASSCLALAVLIWDHQRPPGGVCVAAGCGQVYLTHGSGPPRRYCSRRCATRERVAAHRRTRARADNDPDPGGGPAKTG